MVSDLSGEWRVYSKDGSIDTKIMLPGSSCEAKIGTKQEYYEDFAKEHFRAPRERYEYIGELFYEREIEIPDTNEEMDVSIFLERVNMASKLYIDDVQIGRGIIGLSTPHIYKISGRFDSKKQPLIENLSGFHKLTIAVDNSDLLTMADMASGYSVDTGGYWNGIIGRMELRCKPVYNIDSVQVFVRDGMCEVRTVTFSDRHEPMKVFPATLQYVVSDDNGNEISSNLQSIELFTTKQRNHYSFRLPKGLKTWDEFDRNLYTMTVTLKCCDCVDEMATLFAIRKLYVQDKKFYLNDRRISLRGTINCAQYPLTGYPPMDKESWKHDFSIYRDLGLNHVRFHAWCPPEAAFRAADELGMYLQVEMPLWLNKDVTPWELGDDEWHSLYYRDEALKISETYGNHPSFMFFSNGNENIGDFSLLETITAETKAVDDRRLYTLTSNFDHPLSPYEDYQSAFEINHKRVRIQTKHAEVAVASDVDYSEVIKESKVPVISFEVGQYSIYPDVDCVCKYTGNMLPVNFDLIGKVMKKNGVYDKLNDYMKASANLSIMLYKEDLEAFMRTENMGGIQLLSLVDYTGQSTATVGMLDIFHNIKPGIDADYWKSFCGEVVPLFKAKRCFLNTEKLEADLMLYDFSNNRIDKPVYTVSFVTGGKTVLTKTYKGLKPHLSVELDCFTGNCEVTVFVSVEGNGRTYTNSWKIYVFADNEDYVDAKLIDSKEKLVRAGEEGGVYIATPQAFPDEEFSKNSFVPVFWSPVHFKTTRPTGAMIDNTHGIFADFPTGKYLNYQWKTLIDKSVTMDINDRKDFKGIVEMVPNFADSRRRSPLCEFKYGKADIIFCGFDLSVREPATDAFRRSLFEYVNRAKEN